MATYQPGQAVLLDGAPAVIIEAHDNGTLKVSRIPGMSSYIGDTNSHLSTMENDPSPVFAARIAEVRAYYGVGV